MASCYTYGYLDKVLSVTENDRTITYAYHPDGQLARANYGRARSPSAPQVEDSPSFESFAWDGLALIRRGDEQFVNEPCDENAPQRLCFGGKPRAQRNARRARKGPLWNQLAYCGNGVTGSVDLWGCKEIVLLGEVDYSGHHVATVWAECNHNYNKPEFTIHIGQLKDHPDNEYVKANVDGTTNMPATPNFSYVTAYTYTDAVITHQVTFENFELVVNKAVPVDELFNKIIVWEYHVEFDVKDEWEEYSALKKMTRVEKQEKVSGRHIIEE